MSQATTPNSYAYLAIKPGGRRRFGVKQAQNLGALSEVLRSQNELLLRSWELPEWAVPTSELSLKDHAALNDQLSQLLSRGVPLVEALEVASSTVRPASKAHIERLRELVSAGSGFADACQRVGGFDEVTIAVYRGAERTGDLAGAATQLATTVRRRLAISGKAATLMVYPAIVLSVSLLVATGMLIGVIPNLGKHLRELNPDLPFVSAVVINLGTWMRDNLSLLAVGAAVALFAVLIGRAIVGRFAGLLMRKLPMIKDVVLAQESARFFSVMAAMTRSGVPISDALGVSNGAITHPELRGQLETMRRRLIEGGLLRSLIEEVHALPLATRRLLVAAERSGDLEHAFSALAEDMTDEVDRKSQRVLAALEPVMTIVMFMIIGSFLAAILLPIMTMSSQVQLS